MKITNVLIQAKSWTIPFKDIHADGKIPNI